MTDSKQFAYLGNAAADLDSGYSYLPFVGSHGNPGYQVIAPDGTSSYFYLNASLGSDDGVPTIFVYEDAGPNDFSASVHYYVPDSFKAGETR